MSKPLSAATQAQHARDESIRQAAREVYAAPHGGKGDVARAWTERLGYKSLQSLYSEFERRGLKPASVARRRRSDAGATSLDLQEATKIAALAKKATRDNGKRLLSIEGAVDMLRINGEIRAERIDMNTGEVRALHASTIARALKLHGMHADQLATPTRHTALASLHPNHVWQMDFSICVLFYLATGEGLQVMEERVFNKNKPKNLARVERDRVQRITVVDHASGAFALTYAFGAESALNAMDAFIWATQPKAGHAVQGVCYVLYTDQGPAFKSGAWDSLMRRLMIKHIRHAPGNARATGSVEVHNNIIERQFESSLCIGAPVRSLAELNDRALKWQCWHQATKLHSRHGLTRFAAWDRIAPEQLRVAPSAEIMRALPTGKVERRQFRGDETIAWAGRTYNLKGIDGLTEHLRVKEMIEIATNPYRPDHIIITRELADGGEQHFMVAPDAQSEWNFGSGAAVIGERYKAPAFGPQEHAEKAIAAIDLSALKPTALVDAHALPEREAKVGTALSVPISFTAHRERLSHFTAAKQLREILGADAWNAELFARFTRLYPDSVFEDELADVAARLSTAGGLRIVAS